MKLLYIVLILLALLFGGVLAYKWILKDLPLSAWKWLGFIGVFLLGCILYKVVKGWFFRKYAY